ncbi:MAG: hypothetical protein E7618_04255 [Ruminococcaceae bacterium]|nr:hypothetical protein [Oscillospiraceae bacterium]
MKKNILLIGVGGTGSNAVDTFFKKFHELGNQTDNRVTALVFDTDAGDLKKITSAKTVVMADSASVGTICDRIGKQYLREWFPCDAKDIRAQEMVRGASQWRKKSYLAFLNLMNKPAARSTFISALEDMVQDPGASCEVYVIASVAGGTGSGSFIPIALYAKRYLRKNLGKDPIVNAMIALPDIYADSQTPENRVKVYSNAYAILRELNAINLVARNYNAGQTAKKKAPVRFKIGHEDEPNVGVLFDASDKRFWTPEAAPFSQVFLLDRIPGLNSISAHDMVLANSLYTIICTEIGAAFDSEFSNHELVRSQSNGSNAIYAGISTSQIRFPREAVLEYLAHKRTLSSCDNDWLTIHKTVENKISQINAENKALGRRAPVSDAAYAELVIQSLNEKLNENCEEVTGIYERAVVVYDEKGKASSKTVGEQYFDLICEYLDSRLPSADDSIKGLVEAINAVKGKRKVTQNDFVSLVNNTVLPELFDYYKDCFTAIKAGSVSAADAIITLEKKKVGTTGERYALLNNLLMTKNSANKNGAYVHPVAALIRLCQFRLCLDKWFKEHKFTSEWEELKKRTVTDIPQEFLTISEKVTAQGSAYLMIGDERIDKISKSKAVYLKKKTKVASDIKVLENDVVSLVSNVYESSQEQLYRKVVERVMKDVDMLIKKYRTFFNRFEKERETLVEQTNDALRASAGSIDSVINVYSTEKDKELIRAIIDDSGCFETDAEVLATDAIIGEGTYKAVFAAAVAETSNDENFNANDSGTYRSLFTSMVDAYRASIAKSEMYRNIASYNAVEAIVASCGENPTTKDIDDALRDAFSVAQELAIPSLRLEPNIAELDLVTPSQIMVFMLSLNTAKYIKKNAEKFGIHVPSDQNSEKALLRACAEQFVRDFSGNSSARVAIVQSIPDQILYCTGEIMDITPLCIAKFNELGEDNIYFKNYEDALRRFHKYNTDMWNPHIGRGLCKRGSLPYMNPDMETACDEKMAKALLFALSSGVISYVDGVGETGKGKFNFVCGTSKIKVDSMSVDLKSICKLIEWIRNEDDKIEVWSAAYDAKILEQMESLPAIISSSEIGQLEAAITKTPFIKMLNDQLFATPAANDIQLKLDLNNKWAEKSGISAFELAYLVKKNEENRRDCDDAERILNVLYNTFVKIIAYRLSPKTYPDLFLQVYKQQLNHFYRAIVSLDAVRNADGNCEQHYRSVLDWINQTELFLTFSRAKPFDNNDEPVFDQFYEYDNTLAANALECLATQFDTARESEKDAKARIRNEKDLKKRGEFPNTEDTETEA